MHLFTSKTSRLIPGLAALALLLTANASQAQTVNLTAAPTSTTLPAISRLGSAITFAPSWLSGATATSTAATHALSASADTRSGYFRAVQQDTPPPSEATSRCGRP